MSWVNAFTNTIWNWFQSIINFFSSAWSVVIKFFSSIGDLFEWLWYAFKSVIRVWYEWLNKITLYDYVTSKNNIFSVFDSLLWSPVTQFLSVILLFCVSLIIVRFIFSLIPFFKSWR